MLQQGIISRNWMLSNSSLLLVQTLWKSRLGEKILLET
ncbi:hypothetical protein DSBG_4520 [Desulfosporosinus sp. BG]|nr:hypothetical protein DSBG_4520 [Desulfosporosinus sp. BG]